jgi:hypothetical protein
VTQDFTGDIEGDGAVQLLMAYRADGTAEFELHLDLGA